MAPQNYFTPYPLRFNVAYSGRPLSRVSTALRLLWLIPIGVILSCTGAVVINYSWPAGTLNVAPIGLGGLPFATALMLVFRQKYPRWWFDFSVEMLRFHARVSMYATLTTDTYPSTDEPQAVELDADYPDVKRDLNEWLALIKWLLAIPHVFSLMVLWCGVALVTVYAWFAILITGRYPRGVFNYVVGVHRWSYRVVAYALLLNTDIYPPFSLDERW